MDVLMKYMNDGFMMVLLLSLPAVLVAAAVGLVVGILQAVTQVQEQTIPAAPKITLVFLLLILGGPLMLQMMEEYTREGFYLGLEVIAHDQDMVLPPNPGFVKRRPTQADRKQSFFEEISPKTPSKFKAIQNKPVPGQESNKYSLPTIKKQNTQLNPQLGSGEKQTLMKRNP